MANPFCHIQLNTPDAERAKKFYGELFPWQLNDVPMPQGAYTMIAAGNGPGGGIRQSPSEAVPPHWLTYVEVDDCAAATSKAQSLGATVVHDVTTVEGMGSFAVLTDPTGATFGLWQNA